MSAPEAAAGQSALVEAALRLVEDRPDLPAGSVIRCFSRAVQITRRTGVAADDLVLEADQLARRLLAVWSRSSAA